MKITTETKAVLQTESGRVIGFVKSNEPGKISLAVAGDRAVMTPAQAREVAAWLVEEADRGGRVTVAERAARQYSADERERQDAIRNALGGRTFARRAY
jgi:hypothetical protein